MERLIGISNIEQGISNIEQGTSEYRTRNVEVKEESGALEPTSTFDILPSISTFDIPCSIFDIPSLPVFLPAYEQMVVENT